MLEDGFADCVCVCSCLTYVVGTRPLFWGQNSLGLQEMNSPCVCVLLDSVQPFTPITFQPLSLSLFQDYCQHARSSMTSQLQPHRGRNTVGRFWRTPREFREFPGTPRVGLGLVVSFSCLLVAAEDCHFLFWPCLDTQERNIYTVYKDTGSGQMYSFLELSCLFSVLSLQCKTRKLCIYSTF